MSQTPDGIRLAVVGPDPGALAVTLIDTVTVAPDALADAAAGPAVSAAAPRNQLTPVERLALSVVAQSAATQQDSLAPLFANLGAVAASNALPAKLQQAVMEVLAQRTALDENLTGNDIQHAVRKSGLFFEASLAPESVRPAAGVPDLKAALIVLRQTLSSNAFVLAWQNRSCRYPHCVNGRSSTVRCARNSHTALSRCWSARCGHFDARPGVQCCGPDRST